MEVWRVSGTPAELREAGILDLVAQGVTGAHEGGREDAPDGEQIAQFITRARNECWPHVRGFLDQVLGWDGCRIGTLNARYARIETGSRDTLVYVVPSRPTADIYYTWDENTQVRHGRTLEQQGWTPRLVQVRLDSEEAVQEALQFALESYERQQAA